MFLYLRKRRENRRKRREIEKQAMPDDLAYALGMVYAVYGEAGIKRWHNTQRMKCRAIKRARKLIGDERFKARLRGEYANQ